MSLLWLLELYSPKEREGSKLGFFSEYGVGTWAQGLGPWAQLAIEYAPPHWGDTHTDLATADRVYFGFEPTKDQKGVHGSP